MTEEEFRKLDVGDIVQSSSGIGYVVTSNYGSTKTATRTVEMTNPREWNLIEKHRCVSPHSDKV